MPTKITTTNQDNNSIMNTLFALCLGALVVLVILNIYWYYQVKQVTKMYAQDTNSLEEARVIKEGLSDDVPTAELAAENLLLNQVSRKFVAEFEGISFSYPGSWSVISETLRPQGNIYPNETIVKLANPTQTLELDFNSFIDGLGGGCGDNCPENIIYSVEELPVKNAHTKLFLVKRSYGGVKQMSVYGYQDQYPVAIGSKKEFMQYLLFENKISFGSSNERGEKIMMNGRAHLSIKSTTPAHTNLTNEAFFALPEVLEAESILRSLEYTRADNQTVEGI